MTIKGMTVMRKIDVTRDVAIIRAKLASEGRVEGGQLRLPVDFFDRLNADLNRSSGGVTEIVNAIVAGARTNA
jgi:hypothetical protein